MKKSLLIFVTGLMLINCRNSQTKENTSIEVKKTLDVPCPVTWQEYKLERLFKDLVNLSFYVLCGIHNILLDNFYNCHLYLS